MGDDAGLGFVLFIVFLIGIILGGGVCGCEKQKIERNMAIKANVGRYVVNEKSGEATFVYGVP